MGRLLEVARMALTETLARSAKVTGSGPFSTDKLPVSDPYADRFRDVLDQMNAPGYPAGMMTWLSAARPDLYAELTAHLLDEIQRLWCERAPLEQFEPVLTRLVSLHRRCCELYRANSSW